MTLIPDYSKDSLFDTYALRILKDRYLIEGEKSPQDAFVRVCNAFSDNEEHAKELYYHISNHHFMFSTPVLANGGTTRGLPISCFTGDTPVLTHEGFSYMEDIKVGDKVLTHKGRLRNVVAVKESMSEDVYEVIIKNRRTKLKVTGNHPLLTNTGWVKVEDLKINTHLVACSNKVDYVENEYTIELNNIEKPTNGQFERTQVKESVHVTPALAWALGLWFAEGSTSSVGTLKVTNGDSSVCSSWLAVMEGCFGVQGKVRENRTWFDAEINSKTLCEWFNSSFGKGCKTKTLTPWIVDLPKGHLINFYDGFYLGDGCKTTMAPMIELANPKLIAGISSILMKLGIRHSVQLAKKNPSGAFNGVLNVCVANKSVNSIHSGVEMDNGLLYSQITSITKLTGSFKVYDIQVEEDTSFSAAGVIAHNCFLQDTPDSRGGILEHYNESGWLASFGGGLGANWSKLRTNKTKTSSGGESTGAIPFLSVMDRVVLAFRQAGTRRAAYAAYLDISHPEIVEFINIRKPTGGAAERKSLNIHNAVNISDAFMERLYAEEDSWDLLDPHSGAVTDTVSARQLWENILTLRTETGEPYIHFIDTSNRYLPQAQKNLNLLINNSNLCSEIVLPTGEDRSAVCCLSSVNLEKYDEWKNSNLVTSLIRMLDNVLESFIKAEHIKPAAREAIKKATYSAMRERSLGLGAMGFHSYLQSKMIPFESEEAAKINIEMFSYIRSEANHATWQLARDKGSCPDFEEGHSSEGEQPVRNMHLLSIAPNASSSILCGNTSPSIEPYSAVSFSQKTENGTHIFKNKHLQKLLEDKGLDKDAITSVWRSIGAKKGSVQHLDILSQEEKAVFKTAFEIDQQVIVNLAADRQKYIDQAQSLNLFFTAPIDVKYLHSVHYSAWKKELKTLYYLRSKIESKAENIGDKVERKTMPQTEEFKQTQFKTVTPSGFEIGCIGCEG